MATFEKAALQNHCDREMIVIEKRKSRVRYILQLFARKKCNSVKPEKSKP